MSDSDTERAALAISSDAAKATAGAYAEASPMAPNPAKDIAVPPAPSGNESRDQVIDRWLHDSMHDSIVARDTEVYNHVHAAVQKLKNLLASAD
jgi:hypothetical protein